MASLRRSRAQASLRSGATNHKDLHTQANPSKTNQIPPNYTLIWLYNSLILKGVQSIPRACPLVIAGIKIGSQSGPSTEDNLL